MKHRFGYLCAVLLTLGVLALLMYSTLIVPYRIDVLRHDMKTAFEGEPLRLVQVSDLHLRGFGTHETKLAQQLNALDADVIVLSGDAIDKREALPWLQSFINAVGDVPVVHVPGNWEHWSGLSIDSLSNTGAKLLLNEELTLEIGKRQLILLGLDDFTAGQPDLGLVELMTKPDASEIRVLVQHSPSFFEQVVVSQKMASSQFDLCLAGHTHGGQVTLFGWAPIKPPGSGRFVAGFYDVPGCPLFVSKGVGTSVLPIRLGARPEVVVFDF
jgi:predicted MPP superfamily phosphohydrolase